MIDRDLFYAKYREQFGSIKKQQTVVEINSILDYYEKNKSIQNITVEQLAYILATAYHETAHDFIPKKEYGSRRYFIKRYWENKRVRGWLGNTSIEDAYNLCGRGKVQITGRINYTRYNIVDTPESANDTELSTYILFDGILKGRFTGQKLSKYINRNNVDFIGARKTINGTDRAELIKTYADKYLYIIKHSRS